MDQNFKKIKRNFIFYQYLVLAAALIAGVLVIGLNSVREANKAWLGEMDRISQLVANQLESADVPLAKQTQGIKEALGSLEGDMSEEEYLALTQKMGRASPPGVSSAREGIGFVQNISDQIRESYNYRMFVIDRNGNFVIPRTDDDKSVADDWARYQEKLIYEMTKKRQGWVSYPDLGFWQVKQQKKVIRFIQARRQDWIIAVEGIPKSGWNLFLRNFDKNSLIQLIEILVFSFLGVRFIAHLVFLRIEKETEDLLERQYIGLNNETPAGDIPDVPIRKGKPKQEDHFAEILRTEIKRLERSKQDLLLEVSVLQAQEREKEIAQVEETQEPSLSDAKKKEDSRMELYFSKILGVTGGQDMRAKRQATEKKKV